MPINNVLDYTSVMNRSNQIMEKSLNLNYNDFKIDNLAFDYEKMMNSVGLNISEVQNIQLGLGVGKTPLLELKNITTLARKLAPKGKGARIFLKDEAANPSGSFKDRRASFPVYIAIQKAFQGVITATSGYYGASVASQAAIQGL